MIEASTIYQTLSSSLSTGIDTQVQMIDTRRCAQFNSEGETVPTPTIPQSNSVLKRK